MDSTSEITIRAAGLYRFIHLLEVHAKAYNIAFLENPDDEYYGVLHQMLKNAHEMGAKPDFPIQDPTIMGKIVFYIINWYKKHSAILSEAIGLTCLNNLINTNLFSSSFNSDIKNKRTQEAIELNSFCHELCQKIKDPLDWDISGEFVEISSLYFSTDSQYLTLTFTPKVIVSV